MLTSSNSAHFKSPFSSYEAKSNLPQLVTLLEQDMKALSV